VIMMFYKSRSMCHFYVVFFVLGYFCFWVVFVFGSIFIFVFVIVFVFCFLFLFT